MEDVDLEAGTIYVHGTKSKASRRSLTLPGWLVVRLKARAKEFGTEGFVFPAPALANPNQKWDQSNSTGAVRHVLDAAGLDWAVSHTFRRTVATLLHKAGVPLADIADQLGHSDPSMTAKVYLGRDPEADRPDVAAVL